MFKTKLWKLESAKKCGRVLFALTAFFLVMSGSCILPAGNSTAHPGIQVERKGNFEMNYQVRQEATIGRYGDLRIDRPRYRPLQRVRVTVFGREKGDDECVIRVCDPNQNPYFEQKICLEDNRGEMSFLPGGVLGNHYIYLLWPGEKRHSRYLNFTVDAETTVETGDEDFDLIFPFTRDHMQLGRREYETPHGKFVGYISGDTWHFDGIWLRDWIYGLPAYQHWEHDMQCGIDRFAEKQDDNGMVPDGIERSGKTWRVGLESDVEYIFVLGAWRSWKATGDDEWLGIVLPSLEKALQYVKTDARHWDPSNQLVKRQHSCDTWDFDIDGGGDPG